MRVAPVWSPTYNSIAMEVCFSCGGLRTLPCYNCSGTGRCYVDARTPHTCTGCSGLGEKTCYSCFGAGHLGPKKVPSPAPARLQSPRNSTVIAPPRTPPPRKVSKPSEPLPPLRREEPRRSTRPLSPAPRKLSLPPRIHPYEPPKFKAIPLTTPKKESESTCKLM